MLYEMLKNQGIADALIKLGYDPEAIFTSVPEDAAKTYMTYSWKVVPCSVAGIRNAYVVHAVPPTDLMDTNAWEEWFFQYNKPEHHVLFLKKNDLCTEEIMIPADDTDHPKEIAGKYWYYFCDTKSDPYLCR